MSEIAIRVEKLGKRYAIGKTQRVPYVTLREHFNRVVSAPLRRIENIFQGRKCQSKSAPTTEKFWALKDISFEVRRGEVVGIIGRNGAGKSTLLKLLSRITEPTTGFADIHGRVGSLLEVGTGFHPELTGRENIFLNGVLLGMKRSEVRRKFDEIVSFSEMERFIDTAVKHYSSGMYLRLAFAVAAHLEPEILLVDEVLAVGDARFQKKCVAKMGEVGREGRTVLFVSHNMPAVTRLCDRAILIQEGQLVRDGRSDHVMSAYLHSGAGTSACREWQQSDAPGGEVARLRAVRVRNTDGELVESIDIRHPVGLEMEFEVLVPGRFLLPYFHLFTDQGIQAFTAHDLDPAWRGRRRPEGKYISTAWVPGNLLAEGMFFVHANVTTLDPAVVQFVAPDAVAFQVVDTTEGDSARGDWVGRMDGVVRPALRWETQFELNGHDESFLGQHAGSAFENELLNTIIDRPQFDLPSATSKAHLGG